MPTTKYVWDDDNVLYETDGNDAVTAEYTNSPEQYGDLISEYRSGTTSTHYVDAQGSTVALTNDSGTVTDTFLYNAWGEEVARTGSTATPFQWIGVRGYYWDAERQLYHVRRRSFSTRVGRWLSIDPFIFHDGLHYYRYGRNAAPIFIDPSGNITIKPVSPQHLGNIMCGATGQATFAIQFDFQNGAPCDGYVVQQVDVWCSIKPCGNCPAEACHTCPPEDSPDPHGSYWEAFPVDAGDVAAGPDTAYITAEKATCGLTRQRGTMKFYCKDPTTDPTGSNVGTGDLTATGSGWLLGDKPKIGSCEMKPGLIPVTTSAPAFWTQKPVEPEAGRGFSVVWNCCDGCDTYVFAGASP